MKILKFGGKSLDSFKKTQKICKYIKKIYEKDKKLIVIVSAVGNTTNELIEKSSCLKPEKFAKRELDVLLSTGETMSASLFAMTLCKCGVPAKSFQGWQIKINTHGDFQNSLITSINKTKLDECLESNTIAVIAGFQGVNQNNETTTLGRGGSDTTACAIAAVYNTNVELYSDFNGIFSCDPRDTTSKKINQVSLDQLERVSKRGSRLVSHRAVKIAKENNISILLKSSSKPNLKGSIANHLETENTIIVTKSNLCEIIIDFTNEIKNKLLSKNVLNWLKQYKLYNFTIENHKIKLLANESDKTEILNILTKKLNI